MNEDLLSAAIDATVTEVEEPRAARGEEERDGETLELRATWLIARIDRLLSEQVNAILHHPRFQALEASWRGLRYLCEEAEDADNVKIRFLNVAWKELVRDQERAIEFDQSQLFQLVYSQEFDMPGGEPYGVLLADYYLRHRPSAEHPTDDLGALGAISQAAAASFSPFIASAEAAFLGLEEFRDLERPIDLARVFHDHQEYTKWFALRDLPDARFVGLLLPRILMRPPHSDFVGRADGFRFREETVVREDYLWGNAIYAFGSVLIRTFSDCGWLAAIRGVQRDMEAGGIVTNLPIDYFATDRPGLVPKPSVEVLVSDSLQRRLAEHGFVSLSQCQGTEFAAFYGTPSIQRPKSYDDQAASSNAKISAMLHYIFCVSRFAHYVKVMARECTGSFKSAAECERFLNKWLLSYAMANEGVSTEIQARYPLREAKVQVNEIPGKPGVYNSVIHLRPHFQLDQITTSVTLVTELYTGLNA